MGKVKAKSLIKMQPYTITTAVKGKDVPTLNGLPVEFVDEVIPGRLYRFRTTFGPTMEISLTPQQVVAEVAVANFSDAKTAYFLFREWLIPRLADRQISFWDENLIPLGWEQTKKTNRWYIGFVLVNEQNHRVAGFKFFPDGTVETVYDETKKSG